MVSLSPAGVAPAPGGAPSAGSPGGPGTSGSGPAGAFAAILAVLVPGAADAPGPVGTLPAAPAPAAETHPADVPPGPTVAGLATDVGGTRDDADSAGTAEVARATNAEETEGAADPATAPSADTVAAAVAVAVAMAPSAPSLTLPAQGATPPAGALTRPVAPVRAPAGGTAEQQPLVAGAPVAPAATTPETSGPTGGTVPAPATTAPAGAPAPGTAHTPAHTAPVPDRSGDAVTGLPGGSPTPGAPTTPTTPATPATGGLSRTPLGDPRRHAPLLGLGRRHLPTPLPTTGLAPSAEATVAVPTQVRVAEVTDATTGATAAPAGDASLAPVGLPGAGTTTPAAPSPATAASTGTTVATPAHQVFDHVERLVRTGDGVHRMTLRLDPGTLGEVRIHLQVHDGAVRINLSAGSEARAALAQDSPQLHRLLELAGAQDVRVTVRDRDHALAAVSSSGPSASSTDLGGSAGRDGADGSSPQNHPGSHDPGESGRFTGQSDARAWTRPGTITATDGQQDPHPRVGRAPADPVMSTRTRGVDMTM